MKRTILSLALSVIGVIATYQVPPQYIPYNNYQVTSSGNPFDESTHELFANPWFAQEVLASKTLTDSQKQKLKDLPAAFWVDTYSAIQDRTPSLKTLLDAAAKKQAQSSKKQTVLFIHYNLPNRDCAAAASNGEICCSGRTPDPSSGNCDDGSYFSGDCSKGLERYHQYTDSIVSLLQNYPQLEIVAIVEPDSLPNLATNLGQRHCTDTTKSGYISGYVYAISKLATVGHVTMYIDAAHGGWLGWCGTHPCGSDNECGGKRCLMHGYCECPAEQTSQNAQKYVSTIKDIFQQVGDQASSKVRGFATNTANYQPLGYPEDDNIDHCGLKTQWNFAINEIRYMDFMDSLMKQNGISKTWITDTGRNGKPEARSDPTQCQQWCNVKGGLGIRPTSNVSEIQARLASAQLDAVVWSKTPGESDGCSPNSSQKCTRVDSMCQRDCNSSFQKCPAPEAGQWDDEMIKILVDNAQPAL